LHSIKWSDGKKKKGMETTPHKNDSEGNEGNRYTVPDSNKTKINDIKEYSYSHKNTLKKEILEVITENFMEKILGMDNQSVEEALKKLQDRKNKEYEKTQMNS
jgi:hypothetical protein